MRVKAKACEAFPEIEFSLYARSEGPEATEEFENRAEKIFDFLGCMNEEKFILDTYSLQREADAWLKATRNNTGLDYVGNGCQRYQEAFLDKSFMFMIREDKVQEFDLLRQIESMFVDQYEAKFSELPKYALEMENTPEKRTRKFEQAYFRGFEIRSRH